MKREIQNILAAVVAIVVSVVASMGAMAASVKVQFDFGRNPGDTVESVNSPGLAAGAFTAADTMWNGVSVSTTSYSTLKYSDGTTATGVQAQYGSTGAGSPTSTITWNDNTDLGNTPTGNAGLSLYTSNSMVQNLSFFNANSNHSGGAIAFQVSGLTPGIYDVYVTAVHPDALTRTYNVGVGVDLTQQVASPFSLTAGATTNTWQTGKNYALATSIGIYSTSDWISVISSNLNGFPVINGIQIVETAVPEPSSIALLAAGGFLLARRRGRAARV